LSARRTQIEVQRHARFVDFLVKGAGGLVGIGSVRAIQLLREIAGSALLRFLDRSVERRNHLAEGLQLRNKTRKRRVKAKLRDGRRPATRSNETWAMDFVHDQLATGRKLRVVTIVDIFSRFSPALEPRLTFRGTDVVEILERVCKEVGFPATIRVDQGSEFVSRDLDLSAYRRGVTLDFSRPGKPTDNALIEAFNGRFRAECLNAHWLLSLADAQKKVQDWRKYYNEERPHGSIGNKPPILLQNRDGATSPPS
jgi:putative transposase